MCTCASPDWDISSFNQMIEDAGQKLVELSHLAITATLIGICELKHKYYVPPSKRPNLYLCPNCSLIAAKM